MYPPTFLVKDRPRGPNMQPQHLSLRLSILLPSQYRRHGELTQFCFSTTVLRSSPGSLQQPAATAGPLRPSPGPVRKPPAPAWLQPRPPADAVPAAAASPARPFRGPQGGQGSEELPARLSSWHLLLLRRRGVLRVLVSNSHIFTSRRSQLLV
jgi:hypothetical protein